MRIKFGISGLFAIFSGVYVLLTSGILCADICKWVDEQGVTHFAERCPVGVTAETLELRPPLAEAQQEASEWSRTPPSSWHSC